MKLITYYENDTLRLGAVTDDGVTPLSMTPDAFFANGTDALAALQEEVAQGEASLVEADLTLGPAVPSPSKILCVGLNYRRHAEESGMAPPDKPVLFGKFPNTIAAHGEDVPMAADWAAVDYEAELAVVIGKTARHVSEADALNYVLGYANANDISERDLQLSQPGGQWLLGKTSDKFLPIGPYLITADEIPDPQAMAVKGWMNGDLRQDSNTADMIFSVAEVIAYASRYFTLMPGDVISTGTPEGVILGMEPKNYMQPGDTYTVEIGPLGRLTNTMVAE
ncbi:MAG: fumarylacetoacetate hydrolase family protein [Chloroflexota bacterium]